MTSNILNSAERLAALREELARRALDGFLIPRADEHLGEYVPANAERLAWISGFTGSAGLAVVLADCAVLFTDGRYVLQAAAQTDPALWQRRHLIEEPPPAWLAAHAKGARIGYDPWLFAEDTLARYTDAGVTLVSVGSNPIDAVWHDRPGPPLAPIVEHPLAFAGQSVADKREAAAGRLREAGEDAAVISDPASLAWLLNFRGQDVPYTPFGLGFALLHADAGVELFMAARKIPDALAAAWGNAVSVAEREALPGALAALAGKRVRVDAAATPAWFAAQLRAGGATVLAGMDPCVLLKACKNPVEREGARIVHRRDAVAVCRFLRWLESAAGRETEMSAAAKLLELRGQGEGFCGESFAAIAGAGEHGAVIHYRATPESDRPIKPDETFLIDSGGQYPQGTTDVTRTVWTGPSDPPPAIAATYTRVLKGHVALAMLAFPQGVAGPHVDAIARSALWSAGQDFDHGTGHGVGSFLSVHEGPVSISRAAKVVAIAEGMILSNEPGFYAPGSYGIRIENLLLVQRADFPGATKPFLRFETLTLAPYARRLIVAAMLTSEERAWIDAYHAHVLEQVGGNLEAADRAWLAAACAPLG
ncbi:MAG: aminopeptidase P family protein [Rhodospirillales bacterium]|nr:aminopeptidase P family protein [Rhodospirillales bacterium]